MDDWQRNLNANIEQLKARIQQLTDENAALVKRYESKLGRMQSLLDLSSSEVERLKMTNLDLNEFRREEAKDYGITRKLSQETEEMLCDEIAEWRKHHDNYQYVLLPEKEREIGTLKDKIQDLLTENIKIVSKHSNILSKIDAPTSLQENEIMDLKSDFGRLGSLIEDLSTNMSSYEEGHRHVKDEMTKQLKQKLKHLISLNKKVVSVQSELEDKNEVLGSIHQRVHDVKKVQKEANFLHAKLCDFQKCTMDPATIGTMGKAEQILKDLQTAIENENRALQMLVDDIEKCREKEKQDEEKRKKKAHDEKSDEEKDMEKTKA